MIIHQAKVLLPSIYLCLFLLAYILHFPALSRCNPSGIIILCLSFPDVFIFLLAYAPGILSLTILGIEQNATVITLFGVAVMVVALSIVGMLIDGIRSKMTKRMH